MPHAALASNHEAQNACEGCSTLVDPVLALAVLAGGSYEIWVEAGQVAGSRLGNAAFLVLVTLPLAWRRRRPPGVLAIVTLAPSPSC